MNNYKSIDVLLLLITFSVSLFGQPKPTIKNNSGDTVFAVVKDSVLKIDTIVRIDSFYVTDTLFVPADTVFKKQPALNPTIIFIDSTGNNLPTFGEMLNSVNVVNKIGLFKFVLILFIFLVAISLNFAVGFIKRNILSKRDRTTKILSILPLIKTGIWFFTGYLLIKLIFIHTQWMLFLLTSVALILMGVASLPLLKNIIGRIFILSGNLFSKDDYIRLGNIKGFVQEIGWKNVTILGDEGSAIFIPNSFFIDNTFENISLGKKEELLSLDFDFPSKYDPYITSEVLKEAAISNPFLFINKEPEVFIKSVDFINNRYTIKVNLYLYDSTYIDELHDAMNKAVLNKLNNMNSEGKLNDK
jgi:small-conductance mechanosensitive channel